MRILFVFKALTNFFYYQQLIEELCLRGHHVEVAVDPDAGGEAALLDDVGFDAPVGWDFSSGLSLGWSGMSQRWLSIARSLRSHLNYFRRAEQSRHFVMRSRVWLPAWLQRALRIPLVRPLLGSAMGMKFFKLLETVISPDRKIVSDLRKRAPDLVFASPANRPSWTDAEYIKAAKSLGIPTALMTLSWDNLTTRGVFPVHPDLMLVWNEDQRQEARVYQEVSDRQIVVVGSLFFDKWLDSAPKLGDRAVFIEELGLPEGSQFAVYLGSTRNIAPDETEVVRALARTIRDHPDPNVNSLFLVARPHPANSRPYEDFEEDGVVVWPRKGMLPTTEASKASFARTLKYSVGSIGINTSGMIDAIVNDVPCIAVVSDEYKQTQEDTVHYQQLQRSGVLEEASSMQECAEILRRLINGEDKCAALRAVFTSAFVRPRGDRPVRTIAADAFEMTYQGFSPRQIDSELGSANS